MKRIICILTVIVCCVCSTAACASHVGIQGTVLSGIDRKTILFDFFHEEDGTTLITSALTPDYAVKIPAEKENIYNSLDIIFDITPESMDAFSNRIADIYQEWQKTRYTASSEGIYTGSLFDKATTVCSTDYMLSDLLQYIKTKHHSGTDSRNDNQSIAESVDMLLMCFEEYADTFAEQYNPFVRTYSYDSGRYIAVNLFRQDEVILTISLDNRKDDVKRILITKRENNRYYFRNMTVSIKNEEFTVQSEIYSGRTSLFENITHEDMLISESFTLTENNHTCRMAYDCSSKKTGNLLSASADISSDRLEAGIFLQDKEKETIHISAVRDTEKREIKPEQTSVLDYNTLSENAEYRIALMSGLSLFAAECIPMLPEFHQKMIYQVIFDQ